ncbi:Protein hunchback [Ooceraea biroi]|nr:Protein hunchback [Ooceraea biroi]
MAINPNSNTSNSRRLTENKRLKRCKEQDCNFVTHNITEYWMHKANAHRLSYPYVCRYDHCKFVTKYKHHMKHHQLSKHENVKLYKCDYKDCTYDCVTKSMLASHQKSHWDYYPYQCGSCIYKTKFLNIYKKHLRDNNHKHGMALNKYGVPDPTIVIDIYGTRRGPRQTATATSTHEQNQDCNEQSQAVDKNTAYSNSNILTQYYSWVSDFGLLCAQKVNKLLESYHANTNLGQLQRRSAIDINCESNTSATLTTMQNHYIRYASVMYDMLRQQYYNAFPQNQEKACVSTIGPLDTPLDLRVSEASRRYDQF